MGSKLDQGNKSKLKTSEVGLDSRDGRTGKGESTGGKGKGTAGQTTVSGAFRRESARECILTGLLKLLLYLGRLGRRRRMGSGTAEEKPVRRLL